jgi:cytochrome c biogenesis protein CcmG/thiol:disulfide interchange protein DsbE
VSKGTGLPVGAARAAGLLFPVVVLIALLAWGLRQHEAAQAIRESLARGGTPPVPALALPTFDGRTVSLAGFRGHPVVLNFWASWCVPCAEESGILEGIWQQFRAKGVVVVGVDTQDLEEPARAFVARHEITYLNLHDADGRAAHVFGTTGVPETFFIGLDGRVVGTFPGEQLNRTVWRDAVQALLAGKKPVP